MQQQQPKLDSVFELSTKPGVKRDGTDLDSSYWQYPEWVRFQRGRPRKIGGYRLLTDQLIGSVRHTHIDSRGAVNSLHTFSPWGIEKVLFSSTNVVSGIFNRTPLGFVVDQDYTWQSAAMFQSGGSGTPTLICSSTPDGSGGDGLSSDTAGGVYSGDITGTAVLTAVSDGAPITVSGGCCVLHPFLFLYGSNGLIRNSNANDISTATGWTIGGSNQANIANVAGTKIVRGIPMRGGGQSPAGLFWSLDSLIRVSFVGGLTIWRYDPLSVDVTVLSKASIVEYDNVYFWIGTDRFYMFNGVVQEIPNQMNMNWFFDNLNFEQRSKVWALKVPRFGEIWWFFPFGADAIECNAAIILNVRESTWYDTRITRSAGSPPQIYPSPLMLGEDRFSVVLRYTPTGGSFFVGEFITGLTSGAVGMIEKATSTTLNVTNLTGTFVNGENIEDTTHGGVDTGTLTEVPFEQTLTKLWQHETGTDRIEKQQVLAIKSSIQSNNIQWMTGGPGAEASSGVNAQLRLQRFEPDFIMSGPMQLTVQGRSYAQSELVVGETHTFNGSTEFIPLREQYRELSVKLESNVGGGDFQTGKILMTTEPGDERG